MNILNASLLLLLASFAACQYDVDFGEIYVALPDTDLTQLKVLQKRESLVGSVELRESKPVLFGVRKFKGRWPHVVLDLTVLNAHGDADLYCSPWTWDVAPKPTENAWKSIHSQRQDVVFISAISRFYQDSIVEWDDGRGQGKENIATFACAVYGESSTDTVYELDVDLSFANHTLVDEEQAAMKSVFDQCCAEEGSCRNWYMLTGDDIGRVTLETGLGIEMDFCHRDGNVCNAEGRLTVLRLSEYNMTCELPVEAFQKLEFLEKLDLNFNRLRGDIGDVLAGLSTLKYLHHFSAPSNELSGSLNANEGACLLLEGQLTLVNLINNAIGGTIPGCALAGRNLLELHLSWNMISGELPNTIPYGTQLEALALEHNQIIGQLPSSLGRANLLRFLNLGDNYLKGPIIDEIAQLPLLERLQLDLNSFSKLPSAWSNPRALPPATLTRFIVSSNDIQGSFPIALGKAPVLSRFDLSNNQMSGEIKIGDGDFENVSIFNISYNKFTGQLPEGIGGMRVFTETDLASTYALIFDVSSNELTGEIPELFYTSNSPGVGFGEVRLENNRFTCEKPSELKYIKGLNCNSNESPKVQETDQREANAADTGTGDAGRDAKTKKSSFGAIVAACVIAVLLICIAIAALIFRNRRKKSRDAVLVDSMSIEIGDPKREDAHTILPTDVPRS